MVGQKRKSRFIRDLLTILPILFTAVCMVGYIMLFRSGQSTVDIQDLLVLGEETSEQDKEWRGEIEVQKIQLPETGITDMDPKEVKQTRGKVMFFTMDTLPGYQRAMKLGGPSGEFFIRSCLEAYFESRGFEILRVTSDEMFNGISTNPDNFKSYGYFFFDPWTIITPKHKTRGKFPNMGDKVYILDFFGESRYSDEAQIPLERYLTPYPNKFNTYLGFFINPPPTSRIATGKKKGVIWGKEKRYVVNSGDVIRKIAKEFHLVSSLYKAPDKRLAHSRVKWVGPLPKEDWRELLASSSFLLGLGDPVLGPSALEALAFGCTFINIKYPRKRDIKPGIYAESQHDWIKEVAARDGSDQICTALQGDIESIRQCARQAVARNLTSAYIPKEVLRPEYDTRLDKIFNLDTPSIV